MRSRSTLARPKGVAGRLVLLALFLAVATPLLLVGISRARAQVRATAVRSAPQSPAQADTAGDISGTRIRPSSVTTVNFRQLAEMARRAAASRGPATNVQTLQAAPLPGTVNDSPEGTLPSASSAAGADDADAVGGPGPVLQDEAGGPSAASPSPSQNFLAQEDGPKVGTTSFTIPPDTNGAVGIDRVFTNTNSNYRIHDKATGAPLSTVSTDTFWASSGASGFFDPQIVFDPYQQRWLLAITSNASSANSSINVAVSQTSDPAGSYHIYRFIVGCAPGAANCNAAGEWADFPMIGFNKNWLTVTVNMFQINGTGPGGAQSNVNFRAAVLDYASLRGGTAGGTIFRGTGIGFCNYPVTTYSPTEETLYLIRHLSSAGATYGISRITGTPAAPVFTPAQVALTRPGGGWTQPGGDMLPQTCAAGVGAPTQVCPATLRKIDPGDSHIRSNPAFRNGRIYYAQTIALPAGAGTATDAFGNVFVTADRTAAQWTVVNASSGAFVDGGRVEDPTATPTNGGKWYAYPSVSVNKHGDILMGFSEFESDDYADAGYAFRLGTDAAGTMRDPVIYKEGEDYYQKTFSGTRNRWGDYSHTVIDPSNDRDMWTVQEYAQLRVGTTGTGSNDSRWGTWWAKVSAPAGGNDLLISEFRLRGPNGANDEFVEVYNNSGADLTVTTVDGSAGFAVAASDGIIRCTIPNGTLIPDRGHYLCVNSAGYSLAAYPAGNGTTATGNAAYTTDIADNVGIAIFNTANVANFSLATRLDAVGSTSEANTLYREGAGYPALNASFNLDYSFVRDNCGKAGSPTWLGQCPTGGFPKDANDNAVDFYFVEPLGTDAGGGQRLGAPGPENLSSPIQRNAQMPGFLLDSSAGTSNPPNRVRTVTPDVPNNSTFGTLTLRRRIVNNTGAPVTRLRFRIIDLTTFPAPAGYADLRARTSGPVVVAGVNDAATCSPAPAPCTVTVQGTTLEEPPSQPNGGAFNSTLSAGTVTLATPLAPGQSINVQFLYGIQQTGTFKVLVNIEVLP